MSIITVLLKPWIHIQPTLLCSWQMSIKGLINSFDGESDLCMLQSYDSDVPYCQFLFLYYTLFHEKFSTFFLVCRNVETKGKVFWK